jgi:hypothetical protein
VTARCLSRLTLLGLAGILVITRGVGRRCGIRAPAAARHAGDPYRVRGRRDNAGGLRWDSVYHAQGTESPAGHALIYLGLAVVIVAVPTALASLRSQRNRGVPLTTHTRAERT